MTRLLIGSAVANVLLLAPVWLRFGALPPHWLAVEALLAVAALALLPRHSGYPLRALLAAIVLVALLLGFSSAATHQVLGRSLNASLDIQLLASVYHLLQGLAGTGLAILACAVAAGTLVLGFVGLERGAAAVQGAAVGRSATVTAVAMLVIGATLLAGQQSGVRALPWVRVPVVDTLTVQARQLMETRNAARAFSAEMAGSPGPVRRLDGLAGRDVVLVFVESYGAGILRKRPWRDRLEPRLAEMQQRLADAGLVVASATMASPIRGGQSWLAHATVLSGMRIDNQYRYRLLLGSGRPTLIDDFSASGHRTAAVMPAITMAWPEGRSYGFDAIHAADDLGYAGPSMNWVTMPDQFTMHRFEQAVRGGSSQPLFAQVALISSHAPWTPILPVLDDWSEVGDGSVFGRWKGAGPQPEILWRDLARVREHHAMALSYSLDVVTRWAEASVGDETLVILLGDHPSAPIISGEDVGHGVPVHVISGDPGLLAPFLARGFMPGAWPLRDTGPGEALPGLERLRGWLQAGFGRAGAVDGDTLAAPHECCGNALLRPAIYDWSSPRRQAR